MSIESTSNPFGTSAGSRSNAGTLFALTFLIYGLTYVLACIGLVYAVPHGGGRPTGPRSDWFAANAVAVTVALFLVSC